MPHSTSRSYQIDFLRGIAILAVLILHFNISYRLDQSALNKIFSTNFLSMLASNGNYGVTMFFVISGFLITTNSIERYDQLSQIHLSHFYQLRFARIMPCLLLLLALISIFYVINIPIFQNHPQSTSFILAIFSVLTFWHNVLMEQSGYFNYCLNILWSLSVEEIFYLLFPLSCLLLKKTKWIMLFWLLLIIIGPIYRSLHTNNEIIALYGYLSCFDAIAMGCCTAILAKKMTLKNKSRFFIQYGAGLLIIITYFYSGIMENIILGVSLIALGTAMMILTAQNPTPNKTHSTHLVSRFICWCGKMSYELYLFHIIVLALMKEIYNREALGDYSKLLWFAVFFALSALVALGIAKFYSHPLNRKFRQRLNLSNTMTIKRKTTDPASCSPKILHIP